MVRLERCLSSESALYAEDGQNDERKAKNGGSEAKSARRICLCACECVCACVCVRVCVWCEYSTFVRDRREYVSGVRVPQALVLACGERCVPRVDYRPRTCTEHATCSKEEE